MRNTHQTATTKRGVGGAYMRVTSADTSLHSSYRTASRRNAVYELARLTRSIINTYICNPSVEGGFGWQSTERAKATPYMQSQGRLGFLGVAQPSASAENDASDPRFGGRCEV